MVDGGRRASIATNALDVPEENLRATAAAVHSDRIRAMWAPADGVLSGEREVAGVGYKRMRPYLHGLPYLHGCPISTGCI